ncbi:MAG TPA: UDP-N-acetylmuramate dehydrogenase [Xanthomonadales bacterium]|nr:UDP-N-acetylmuramate dehydrogenase [Xanthomonadales bacterium]
MIIQNDFSLKETLWYKIGGKAKYLITCSSKEDITEAFEFIQKNRINKVFIVGLGSNLLFTDDDFDGAIIKIANDVIPDYDRGSMDSRLRGNDKVESSRLRSNNNISVTDESLVEVFAGVTIEDLVPFCFDNNLIGLEWAGGLPGTVGGAVRGNAGAYGGEIKDDLVSAEVLDYSGDKPVIKTLINEELQFSYRNSHIKQNKKMVVISAKFKLQKTDSDGLEKAREVYEKNIQSRIDKHPLEYPNTGSVFINPRKKEDVEKVLSIYPDLRESVEQKWYGKVAVATLIDRWGLKGYRVGDAQISEKHALFIVNRGNAKYIDVLQIMEDVKKKFMDTFGFVLHVEVEIVK